MGGAHVCGVGRELCSISRLSENHHFYLTLALTYSPLAILGLHASYNPSIYSRF